jgi:hypothetical protein
MPGSITKEFPLDTIDATLKAIRPGMTLDELRAYATQHTHKDVPVILGHRFVLVEDTGRISYDLFMSLMQQEGVTARRIRKIMYFAFAMRDERIRRFICERVADRNGHWRVNQLTNKRNADFFEQFFRDAPARKARSNIERFLVEAGIVHLNTEAIHLEREDGWLIDAMRVAAQHEPNRRRRRAMVDNPVEYLIRQGLNGLANVSVAELRSLDATATAIAEEDPLEDDVLEAATTAQAQSRTWNRRRPLASDRATASATIDLVARERAATSHWELEHILSTAARALGLDPKHNNNIDMHFDTEFGSVLAEMKSCHRRNLHSQVRRAVSQLLEYRFRYRDVVGESPTLLLVLETRPAERHGWIVEYLQTIGIVPCWRVADRLVTSSQIPQSLDAIIHQTEA